MTITEAPNASKSASAPRDDTGLDAVTDAFTYSGRTRARCSTPPASRVPDASCT
jgi:hypothetical protein